MINKLKQKKPLKFIAFVIFLCISISAQAQLPGFPDDVDDETPAAPIDGLLGLGLVAGTAMAYRKFRKTNNQN